MRSYSWIDSLKQSENISTTYIIILEFNLKFVQNEGFPPQLRKRNCLHCVSSFFFVLITQTILQQQSRDKNRHSSNILLVELRRIELLSENKSNRFSPSAGYALHSLRQNSITKAMTSVVSYSWSRSKHPSAHVHHWYLPQPMPWYS